MDSGAIFAGSSVRSGDGCLKGGDQASACSGGSGGGSFAEVFHRLTAPGELAKRGLAMLRFSTPDGPYNQVADVHVLDLAAPVIVADGFAWAGAGAPRLRGLSVTREHTAELQPEYVGDLAAAPTAASAERRVTRPCGSVIVVRARRVLCFRTAHVPRGFRLAWDPAPNPTGRGLLVATAEGQALVDVSQGEDDVWRGYVDGLDLDRWDFCGSFLLATPQNAAFLRGETDEGTTPYRGFGDRTGSVVACALDSFAVEGEDIDAAVAAFAVLCSMQAEPDAAWAGKLATIRCVADAEVVIAALWHFLVVSDAYDVGDDAVARRALTDVRQRKQALLEISAA